MLYSETITAAMATFVKDKLHVKAFSTRDEMGKRAASDIAETINDLLQNKPVINIIFAAAPSQKECLHYLTEDESIDWSRVNAFHMDEYIGLANNSPQSFGNFLKNHIFAKVPFRSVNYIDGSNPDFEEECERYAKLLNDNPVDIVCLGIGENGHIAFNDPPVANFNDPKVIKVVKLDLVCRQQQVNDKCFDDLSLVPTHAFTLTIPALINAEYMFCVVPSKNKAEAIFRTLNDEVSEKCPATILRTRNNVLLYLDKASSSLILKI
jgi:glucosamine-6-phosphate deaminase